MHNLRAHARTRAINPKTMTQQVHFTRSLFKYLLGSPVSFNDFETDDPQLFKSKVGGAPSFLSLLDRCLDVSLYSQIQRVLSQQSIRDSEYKKEIANTMSAHPFSRHYAFLSSPCLVYLTQHGAQSPLASLSIRTTRATHHTLHALVVVVLVVVVVVVVVIHHTYNTCNPS